MDTATLITNIFGIMMVIAIVAIVFGSITMIAKTFLTSITTMILNWRKKE